MSIRRDVLSTVLKTWRSRLLLLAAVAMLVGQLGAQAHAYSHSGSPSAPSDQLHTHHDLCQECLAFTPLLAGAGGLDHTMSFADAKALWQASSAGASLISLELVLAFRSRAPPSSL